MSDTLSKETIVPSQQMKKGCMSRNKCLLFIIIFILLISAIGSMYYLLFLFENNLKNFTKIVQKDQHTLQNKISQLQASSAAANQSLKNDFANIKKTVEQINQFQQANKSAWLMAEARYLIKLANDNIQYTANLPLSLKLLESADKILSNLANPKLVSLRQALANDIAHLQSTPQVDVDGIYARLAALHREIDQLPLIEQPSLNGENKKTKLERGSWWQRGLQATWAELKTIVIVRYNEKGTLPLLPPEQKTVLYQNLHAEVAQAIWALLHGEEDIYLSSLEQMTTWIKQYFMANNTMTEAVLVQLTNLQKLYIRPASPKLEAFQQI